jgi:hypothetical protein
MTAQVFNGIDHIMVRVREVEPFIRLFENIFALPVSWPLQRKEFATYAWITLGNTNLEFWAAADNTDLPVEQSLPLYSGLALNPSELGRSIALLQERGITCKPPRSFITKNREGRQVTNFTNSVILDISNSACCVFFCKWEPEGTIFPWLERLTAEERQLREQRQFDRCGGGPIGIVRLAEVAIATPEMSKTRQQWQAITGQTSDRFDLGRRIVLTLHAGETVQITSIVLAVESLAVARAYLASHSILGKDSPDEISIGGSVCSDLCIRLKEVMH